MYLLKVVRLGGEQTTQKQIFTLTQFSPVLKQVVVGRLDDVFLEMWWFIGGDVVVHLGGGDMIISLVEMWWQIGISSLDCSVSSQGFDYASHTTKKILCPGALHYAPYSFS